MTPPRARAATDLDQRARSAFSRAPGGHRVRPEPDAAYRPKPGHQLCRNRGSQTTIPSSRASRPVTGPGAAPVLSGPQRFPSETEPPARRRGRAGCAVRHPATGGEAAFTHADPPATRRPPGTPPQDQRPRTPNRCAASSAWCRRCTWVSSSQRRQATASLCCLHLSGHTCPSWPVLPQRFTIVLIGPGSEDQGAPATDRTRRIG